MLDRILGRFGRKSKTADPQMNEAETDLLVGALFVRMARTDAVYMQEEARQIDRIFALKNDLSAADAEKFRNRCEALESEMPGVLEVSGLIRAATDAMQRRSIVAALWSIVFADQIEHQDEMALFNMIEDLLGIQHQDSMALRDAEALKIAMASNVASELRA